MVAPSNERLGSFYNNGEYIAFTNVSKSSELSGRKRFDLINLMVVRNDEVGNHRIAHEAGLYGVRVL